MFAELRVGNSTGLNFMPWPIPGEVCAQKVVWEVVNSLEPYEKLFFSTSGRVQRALGDCLPLRHGLWNELLFCRVSAVAGLENNRELSAEFLYKGIRSGQGKSHSLDLVLRKPERGSYPGDL